MKLLQMKMTRWALTLFFLSFSRYNQGLRVSSEYPFKTHVNVLMMRLKCTYVFVFFLFSFIFPFIVRVRIGSQGAFRMESQGAFRMVSQGVFRMLLSVEFN